MGASVEIYDACGGVSAVFIFAMLLCRKQACCAHSLSCVCSYHRRRSAEASNLGYAAVVRDLRAWVQGFVGRASEGFFEREAFLAR